MTEVIETETLLSKLRKLMKSHPCSPTAVAIRTDVTIPDAQISLEVCDVIDADHKDPKATW